MKRLGTFVLALALSLLLFCEPVMQAVSDGAGVFVSGVMPSLLPMMVLSRLAPAGGGIAQAIAFGFISGSPASAQRALSVGGPGLEPLLAAVGVMSPMFFIGTLARWTGQAAACWVMLLCHWAGALITAGLWRLWAQPPAVSPAPQERTSPVLTIQQSAQALLGVCGAITVFSAAAALLKAAITRLFPLWAQQNARLFALVWALMEVGGGSRAVLCAWDAPPYALLCALCSFGGLSIWMQNLLFTGKSIRPGRLLLMRALHGAVSYGLCKAAVSFLFS